MRRKKDLQRNGVGSQKELEEAENALEIAEKEYDNTLAALKIFQADPQSVVLGQPLVVRSPIEGDIIENKLVTGLYLNDDSENVATVANLSQIWVAAQVKEKDLRFIHNGDEMKITVPAYPDLELKGIVYHIDEAVDEETRSIKILSICDNPGDLLKIGMYTTVCFVDKEKEHTVIAEKALLQDENNSYVFVELEKNKFVKRIVEVEMTNNGKVIVTKGLTSGDRIISEGGYYLK